MRRSQLKFGVDQIQGMMKKCQECETPRKMKGAELSYVVNAGYI